MAIRRLLVEDEVGAITAFVEINGLIYGLSAQHVLKGSNDAIDRNEHVDVFEDVEREWLPGGITRDGFWLPGSGSKPDDFGIFDAAIFSPAKSFEDFLRGRLTPLSLHPSLLDGHFSALRGMRVFAYSVMYKKVISGTIAEVFGVSNSGNRYDLIIDSDDNEILTRTGDSGILWYDSNRQAIGMHIRGNAEESTLSFATFIHRMINRFGVNNFYVL